MKVPRELQSLGIRVFIEHFSFWKSKPNFNVAIKHQEEKKISNHAGAARRAGAAKKIFENKALLITCLEYASDHAKKVSGEIKRQANQYWKEMECAQPISMPNICRKEKR
jgi:hypothetical protein